MAHVIMSAPVPRPLQPLPHHTVTLVPQSGSPKLRNLALGDSSVPIKKSDHSEASKAAHATASIMGVAPEGGSGAAAPKKLTMAQKAVGTLGKVARSALNRDS